MAVQSAVTGDEVRISVDGRFDFSVHREFRDAYRDTDGPSSRYRVDLARVEYLDSSALGMLLLLKEFAGGDRGRVAIEHCQPEVKKILEVANFHRLFELR